MSLTEQQKKELSLTQKIALRALNEKLKNAQAILSQLVTDILKEHNIPESEFGLWSFQENFSYLEKKTEKKK